MNMPDDNITIDNETQDIAFFVIRDSQNICINARDYLDGESVSITLSPADIDHLIAWLQSHQKASVA